MCSSTVYIIKGYQQQMTNIIWGSLYNQSSLITETYGVVLLDIYKYEYINVQLFRSKGDTWLYYRGYKKIIRKNTIVLTQTLGALPLLLSYNLGTQKYLIWFKDFIRFWCALILRISFYPSHYALANLGWFWSCPN